MTFARTPSGYDLSDDPQRLDIGLIHAFLTKSYWSPGIPLEVVRRSIENSLCFGVYDGVRQVGFARAVTDRTTFAMLADVFILEPHRGKGLSKQLIAFIMAHPDLQGLRRFSLSTLDAHGLYRQFGFAALGFPDRQMEILRPNIYLDS